MARALVAVTAWLVIVCVRTATADPVDRNIHQLSSEHSYKVRLAAALALSKSKDARAVLAISDSLAHDEDATLRRVAALALEKMIDAKTADDARQLGLAALDAAAASDADMHVRSTAEQAAHALAGLKRHGKPAPAAVVAAGGGDGPEVFVNIDATVDQSHIAPQDAPDRITRVVKAHVEQIGFATSWSGGLPTQAELTTANSRAFIVAATVKRIDVSKVGHQMEIACTVAIRVAPWAGKDGGERWEANKAASASGSAKAVTGPSAREVAGGMRDCLEAVSEDVTARQVLPFLKHLALTGS